MINIESVLRLMAMTPIMLKLQTITKYERGLTMARIETPRMSEILYEEFMEPLELSAYKLANAIGVPVSRIQDILHDRRKVTVDTSLRLGKYFGMSDRYFLNLQNDIDIRNEKELLQDELDKITVCQYAAVG